MSKPILEANAVVPLYRQLMEKLQKEITSGILKPGDRLLPEVEMAKYYQVSVITARKAMDELAAQGLIEKKQGKGTFVTSPKYGRDYTHIQGFSESCLARGLKPGARLLQKEIVAPKSSILESLGLDENSQTVKIVRLRYVNDEPMVIETSYFPLDYAFLLHLIASMKPGTGRGACILPHGVLFRGNAEYEIRKHIIRQGWIEGIVGLPANIFFGTGIPASIILINKQGAADRKGIFFVDAKDGFVKDGNKNRLREQDIKRIVDTWNARHDVPHYAKFVPISGENSIEANDYNLNIPRLDMLRKEMC